jgi:DNA-directed RNA polymerase beta' subunit
VWDVLEEVIKEHPVLLNRAPTLHRLGIQAFEPVLVEGKAIQIHPLVCTAFNADFDGDQMAVHLPLSAEAQAEARVLMLSANNVLSPAHGRPLVTPTQDMIIGAYYLTEQVAAAKGEGRVFRHLYEVERAYEAGDISLHALIEFRGLDEDGVRVVEDQTTAGRLFFNTTLPDSFEFINQRVDKKIMGAIVDRLANDEAKNVVASSLDAIKNLCFRYAAQSGITISIDDVKTPSGPRPRSWRTTRPRPRRSRTSSVGASSPTVSAPEGGGDLDRRHRQGARRHGEEPQGRAVQPHRHDGGLGCPRQHDAGPPDRRHAWPGGQPPWRHDPPPDQVQLP